MPSKALPKVVLLGRHVHVCTSPIQAIHVRPLLHTSNDVRNRGGEASLYQDRIDRE